MHHRLIDHLARGRSQLHRLDPRLELGGLLVFVLCVVLCPVDQTSRLAPYLLSLLGLIALARLPLVYLLRRGLLVLPFVGLVVVFLPFRSHGPPLLEGSVLGMRVALGRDGLLMAGSILAKAYLCTLATTLLAATTTFPEILRGMRGLGMPRLLVTVLSFLYRYLFVLSEEGSRILRAARARGFGALRPRRLHVASRLVAALLLRSYTRAERVFLAMSARGYDGQMRYLTRPRLRPGQSLATALAAGLWVLLWLAL